MRIVFYRVHVIEPVFREWYSPASAPMNRGAAMIEDKQNEWKLLCEKASSEQDFEKLLELTNEILRLTEPKRKRLQPPPDNNDC